MADKSPDLIDILNLEEIDNLIFRGFTPQGGMGRMYGGQVIAQGLSAAMQTVEGRVCHSLHAYFLRAGDRAKPVIYHVDVARDGGSFSSRRVTAVQNGKQILNMALSFQVPEKGLDHAVEMPDVPDPESLKSMQEIRQENIHRFPEKYHKMILRKRAYEVRPVNPVDLLEPEPTDTPHNVWLKLTQDNVPNDPEHQRLFLAYMSDITLLDSGLRVHGKSHTQSNMQTASLDHSLWFHADYDVNEWLLYVQNSPVTAGGRGLNFGHLYTRDGTLVASAVQEGLMRVHDKPRK